MIEMVQFRNRFDTCVVCLPFAVIWSNKNAHVCSLFLRRRLPLQPSSLIFCFPCLALRRWASQRPGVFPNVQCEAPQDSVQLVYNSNNYGLWYL